MKICSTCKKEKDESLFYKSKSKPGGLHNQCKECSALSYSRWRSNPVNREKDVKAKHNYYNENKDDFLNRLCLKNFGISLDEKQELLNKQDGKCAICGTNKSGKRDWHVDHDHSSVDKIKIRGILCRDCNIMLGMAKDNINILFAAIAYLKRYKN